MFWLIAFGSTVGSPIRLDNQICLIAGVIPPSFDSSALARLRPHVAMSSAQAETSLLHHRLHKNHNWGAALMSDAIYKSVFGSLRNAIRRSWQRSARGHFEPVL